MPGALGSGTGAGLRGCKRSVTRARLLDLLLLVAATTRTPFAIATRHFAFAREAARAAPHHDLCSLGELTDRLADALHAAAVFTRRDRRRPRSCAIDLHYVPFYGSRDTPGIVGGPKKAGASSFHCYATRVLIHRRRGYAVGLLAAHGGQKPHQ